MYCNFVLSGYQYLSSEAESEEEREGKRTTDLTRWKANRFTYIKLYQNSELYFNKTNRGLEQLPSNTLISYTKSAIR